jgi:hypothetical protein
MLTSTRSAMFWAVMFLSDSCSAYHLQTSAGAPGSDGTRSTHRMTAGMGASRSPLPTYCTMAQRLAASYISGDTSCFSLCKNAINSRKHRLISLFTLPSLSKEMIASSTRFCQIQHPPQRPQHALAHLKTRVVLDLLVALEKRRGEHVLVDRRTELWWPSRVVHISLRTTHSRRDDHLGNTAALERRLEEVVEPDRAVVVRRGEEGVGPSVLGRPSL